LVALFSIGAIVESVQLTSLRSPSVWGHLRTGAWILENRGVPRTGLFSQSANLPWRDFSWGFDVLAAAMYRIAGLRVVAGLLMGFRLLAALVLFLLAGGRKGNVWVAAALAAVGLYTLSSIGPAVTGASIVLFGLELSSLAEWRRRPEFRAKLLLPVLFLVWANLDTGFVYGIAALALFVTSLGVERTVRRSAMASDARKLLPKAAIVLLTCGIVSGVTPYGYSGYPAFWQMETSAANASIPGYAAMGFRQPLDYVVLLLGMSAFLALGLRRSHDVSLIGLLGGSAMLAFHSQRESWLLMVSGVAVIGWMLSGNRAIEEKPPIWRFDRHTIAVAGSSTALAALAFVLLIPRDSRVLLAKVGETLPVKACDYIRSAGLAQPLFNDYEWGGFVTWYLPEYPVAIDGRRGLYPQGMESDYFKVMQVDVPYQSFPAMKNARTILLEKSNVVAQGLKTVPGFRVAYEDDVAIVLLQDTNQ
jgi:hypothetical protein